MIIITDNSSKNHWIIIISGKGVNDTLIYIYIYIYIYVYSKVRLANVVDGDPKVLFSTATTPRGATPFSGLTHFFLDTYLIMLSF